jgi:hypothetical protein
MIPTFIAKQQELQPEYEHIKNVSRELKQLKEEYGVVIRHAPSQATTSFMNRRGSQARQYELITSQIRHNRVKKYEYKADQKQQMSVTAGSGFGHKQPAVEQRCLGRARSLLHS